MDLETLRSAKEKSIFPFAVAISVLVWAGFILSIVGIFYLLMGAFVYWIMHSIFLAQIKGQGVRISHAQFPDLHSRIFAASQKFGLKEPPEAYLLNDRGVFNAFATRFLGRNFIVLYTELLENCDEDSGAIDFIIGHEIGHLALGHLGRRLYLLPAKFVPLLGPAYSRACEYSCDLAGRAMVKDNKAAVAGLAVLAAGGKYAPRLNVDEFISQMKDSGRYWLAIIELNLSHPYLCKRVAAILRQENPNIAAAPKRNAFSYFAAPFMGFAAVGNGAGAGVLVIVAVIGVLAAIAIPKITQFKQQAEAAAQEQMLYGTEGQGEEGDAAGESEAAAILRRKMEERQQQLLEDMRKAEAAALEEEGGATRKTQRRYVGGDYMEVIDENSPKAPVKRNKVRKHKNP